MRTAEEFCAYCEENQFGQGASKKWDLMHFRLIEEALKPGENVIMAFEAMHNYISTSKHQGYFAYAVTDRRFLLAQKRAIGNVLQSVSLENINDITYKAGLLIGIITVDTIKEVFSIGTNKKTAGFIHQGLHDALEIAKRLNQPQPITPTAVPTLDATDELIKLKQLLDMGVITQEDFDTKKRQLLGI